MKRKVKIIVALLFTVLEGLTQEYYFSGYLLDQDSVPVENAVLINYRTVRAFTTDSKGYFNLRVLEGDSFKINHIVFKQEVIHSNPFPASQNQFFLQIELNEIEPVEVKYKTMEQEYLNRNMEVMMKQFRKDLPNPPSPKERTYNTYYHGKREQFFHADLFEIIRWIKKKKKEKNK